MKHIKNNLVTLGRIIIVCNQIAYANMPDMSGMLHIHNHGTTTLNIIMVPAGSTIDVQGQEGCKIHVDTAGAAGVGPLDARWPWLKNCKSCWHSFMKHIFHKWDRRASLGAYIKENRWSLAAKGLVGTYVGVNFLLFRLVNFLGAPQRWMYWRSDLFLVQLMRMSSADLIQELLAELGTRTALAPDQTPFQVLFDELDDEICQLQRYTRWAKSIAVLGSMQSHCAATSELFFPNILGLPVGYLMKIMISSINIKNIFYIHEQLIQHTPEYLRRLMYLRRILEEELAIDLPQDSAEVSIE